MHKIEQIKININQKKGQIFQDFTKFIDEIKQVFEYKLNDFVTSFNDELHNLEKMVTNIMKNQYIFPLISDKITNILNDFEILSKLIEQNLEKKPKKQRNLSVHFDKKTIQAFSNITAFKSSYSAASNEKKENNIFENINDFRENTIINTPVLLMPQHQTKSNDNIPPESRHENQDSIKFSDNLEDLKRKSSIFSYEELIKRPRATTKNIRPETFAKMYLFDLYKKSKELYNLLEIV